MSTEPKEKKPATPEQLANLAKARAVRDQNRDQKRAMDAEARSQQIADEALGFRQAVPPPPTPKYVEPTNDPDIESTRLAIAMLQERLRQEEAARDARVKSRSQSYRDVDRGRIPVELKIQRPEMPNPLDTVDDTDPDNPVQLGTPGYVKRWVRVKESPNDTADNTFRLRTFQAWGAKVLKKKNGDPLRTGTLMCVEIPVEANARRIIAASPSGAFDTAQPVERLQQFAEDENMAYGRRHYGAPGGVLQVDGSEVTTTAIPVHPFAPE